MRPEPCQLGIFTELAASGFFAVQTHNIEQLGNPAFQIPVRNLEKPAIKIKRLFAVEKAIEITFFRQKSDFFIDGVVR